MIPWKHIMNAQPDNGRTIVKIDPPYKQHFNIGLMHYYQECTHEELLKWNAESGWPNPNYWWVYRDEFPTPWDVKCDNGHDWMHIPLSDVRDCRRCGLGENLK